MNLLQIQDALKGASDQQLIGEMQNPSGSVPQYLVLSELDRRKHMRAQVRGQTPDTTVADDAVAGIAALAPRRAIDPDIEEQRQDEDGISAFREGGVVRMQVGGPTPPVPLSTLSRDELDQYLDSLRFGPGPRGTVSPYSESDIRNELMLRRPRSGRSPEITSTQQYPGVGDARFMPAPGTTNAPTTIPDMTPDYLEGAASILPAAPAVAQAANTTPNPFVGGTPNAQTAPGSSSPQGGGTGNLRGAGGGGGAAPVGASVPGGTPSWEDIRNRVIGDTPDQLRAMAEEVRRNRPSEGERRNEALNMALIEAGLRIAGSQSPHFAQALSEGAVPAVQGYTRAIGDIRKETREATKDELEVRMAQITNMYRAGQISASLYNVERDSIDKELDRRNALQRANITAGSSAADRAEARKDRAATATADREARSAAAAEAQTTNTLRVLSDQIKNDRETVNSAIFRARPEADRKPIEDRLNRAEQQYNSIMRHRLSSVPGAVVDWNEFRTGNR